MKLLSIDRFEDVYAICEDNDGAKFAIPVQELPQGAKEGTCLRISDDGTLSVDEKATADKRRENYLKQKKLLERK